MQDLFFSCKPVTTNPFPESLARKQYETAFKMAGCASSCGIIEGPCTIIRKLKDLQALEYGAILVCEGASPSLIPFMPFLGGVCTERGGTLSIASGYARKYGVPAVVGVKGLMGVIRNGDVIRIDGSMGTVDIIREKISGECT